MLRWTPKRCLASIRVVSYLGEIKYCDGYRTLSRWRAYHLFVLPRWEPTPLFQIVRFIPIDAVAGAILDLVFYPRVFPPAMNVVHPAPMAWNHLIKLTSEALVAQRIIRSPLLLVPCSEWVEKLEMWAKTANGLDLKKFVCSIPIIRCASSTRPHSRASN